MSEPLLRVRNHHAACCGDPPTINGDDPDVYIGYFENEHSEQWIFTFHRRTGQAELRGGDVGWDEVHPVQDGQVDDLFLSPSEQVWLVACWEAATWVTSHRPSATR